MPADLTAGGCSPCHGHWQRDLTPSVRFFFAAAPASSNLSAPSVFTSTVTGTSGIAALLPRKWTYCPHRAAAPRLHSGGYRTSWKSECAETGDREDGEATGTNEAGNIATGGEATSPVPPGSPSAELGLDDWQCPICFGNYPQQARVRPQCCGSLICIECTRQIVGRELAAIREQIRRNSGRANGAQQRRRRLPFSCPMCRQRSALQRDAEMVHRSN